MHQVAKGLEFQLQHQSFQQIFMGGVLGGAQPFLPYHLPLIKAWSPAWGLSQGLGEPSTAWLQLGLWEPTLGPLCMGELTAAPYNKSYKALWRHWHPNRAFAKMNGNCPMKLKHACSLEEKL